MSPRRRVEGQTTLLGRTMHSIEYDPIHDEFSVPQQFAQAILTFRGGANGEEPPIRIIQGSLTQMEAPSRLALDPVNNEIFVPEGDKLMVYPREANGNTAPIRVLEAKNLGASSAAVDPIHNLLILTGSTGERNRSKISIFDRKASGNDKPKAVIMGPKSLLTTLGGPHTVYPPTGKILVTVRGDVGFEETISDDSFVGVWDVTDNGDVAPHWTIGGPKGVLLMVRGVAVIPKYKEVLITDKRMNAILTFNFPEIF